MLKSLTLLILFVSTLVVDAKEFTIASYNVENLFDLKKDGTEYKEYTPNRKLWNYKTLQNKLTNIKKVLDDLDADIVALQEIESKRALKNLLKILPSYKYYSFAKKETSSVGVALISKYPIIKSSFIDVDKYDKTSRHILKSYLRVDKKVFIVYVNHWRSKRAPESKRIIYAMALKEDINKLKKDQDYIILGDLNSNYNEYHTFKFDKKFNDTLGITGINQVLNTTIKQNFIQKATIFNYSEQVHYNLWLELKGKSRFSSIYKGEKITPDNILIPKSLFDDKGISYIDKSFYVLKKEYLFKKGGLNRWNIYKAKGYSDHLPIVAKFSTTKQEYKFIIKKQLHTIDTLYQVEQINDFDMKDLVVIYKNKKIAIVTHKDQKLSQRAIMIYNPPKKLQEGGVYDFTVNSLEVYHGLKEIKSISNIKKTKELRKYKDYYKNGASIDLFKEINQNLIVTNLKGVYKKRYLHYTQNNRVKKIKIYFKKGIKRPKYGDRILIKTGHLGVYKTKEQIILYNTKDYLIY